MRFLESLSLFALTGVVSGWVNTEVLRSFQLTDAVVEVRTMIMVRNDESDPGPYHLHVPFAADTGALVLKVGAVETAVTVDTSYELSDKGNGVIKIDASLLPPSEEESTLVTLVAVYGLNILKPWPASIMEMETQYVVMGFSPVIDSPYVTEAELSMVRLPPNTEVHSATPADFFHRSNEGDLVLDFTTESRRTAFKKSPSSMARVHFKYPQGLPYIDHVKKVIDVSHLGAAITVTESVRLVNGAASVLGEFNRIPFTHMKFNGLGNSPFPVSHTVLEVQAVTPVDSFNIHYRDVIGNVSSSQARREPTSEFTLVQIRPRFPLLGGWKTEFDFSFNEPVSGRLWGDASSETRHMLRIPIGHSFPRLFAKEQEVEIVLPSGAGNVELSLEGRGVVKGSLKVTQRRGWMDTPLWGGSAGKTVVSFSLGAVYETSFRPILVRYTVPRLEANKGPILLVLYIMAGFCLFILTRRISIRIANPKEETAAAAQDADYDVCKCVSHAFTDLSRVNSEVVEKVLNKSGELPSAREQYIANHSAVAARVAKLCERFVIERNRVDRTVRINMNLKAQHDVVLKMIEASSGDVTNHVAKLIDLENDMKSLVERVLGASEAASRAVSGTHTPVTEETIGKKLKKKKN
jgi:oligosaccharyltransferase complex subunit alpha (ribophorin I)